MSKILRMNHTQTFDVPRVPLEGEALQEDLGTVLQFSLATPRPGLALHHFGRNRTVHPSIVFGTKQKLRGLSAIRPTGLLHRTLMLDHPLTLLGFVNPNSYRDNILSLRQAVWGRNI